MKKTEVKKLDELAVKEITKEKLVQVKGGLEANATISALQTQKNIASNKPQ
jgi:hypothetical protein